MVFLKTGALKCARLGSLVVVWNPGGSTRPGRRGSHTTAQELQTCTFEGSGASEHHQNSTRRPPERHNENETEAGKGRKSAKFWAPHPSGPHPSGTLRGRFGQNRSIKVGQSRSKFSGQSRFGQSRNWPKSVNKDGQSRIGRSRSQPGPEGWGPGGVGARTQKKWGPKGWGSEGWGPQGWGPERWGPEGPNGGGRRVGGPKFRFFGSLPPEMMAKCGQIRMAKSGLAKCGHGSSFTKQDWRSLIFEVLEGRCGLRPRVYLLLHLPEFGAHRLCRETCWFHGGPHSL